ncbi:MAG TPA: hypothetical protein VFA24_02885 [Gaiellaceae bacterium]|nr:hypothetical protein [Gaiellaceae bacterium]
MAHPAYDEARRLLARIARLAEPEDEARLAALEAAVAEERQLRLAAERLLAARVLELEVLRRRKEPEEPGEPGQTKPKPRPKGPPIELPRVADEHAYWLRRCEGFRVATGEQTAAFGTVEATCFGHRHDRPDELLVTIGRRRTIALPVAAVVRILPEEELVIVLPEREPLVSSVLDTLRERVSAFIGLPARDGALHE